MAKLRMDQPVLPSLLDRLIDDEQDLLNDVEKPYSVLLADIKNSIRRDLECLLNTRLHRKPSPEKYTELSTSVVNYGLPDFSFVQLSSDEGKEELRLQVQTLIEKYEPRFRQVHVELAQIGEDYERTLYMKISAVLLIEPDPIPLLFDSRVKSVDKAVHLRELNHG